MSGCNPNIRPREKKSSVTECFQRPKTISPSGLRNKILLLMGYETMCRRAELVGFEFDDLTCLLNGKPALRLRFSKADQYGEGRLIEISQELAALIEH